MTATALKATFSPTLITVKVGETTLRIPEPNARNGRALEALVRRSINAVDAARKRAQLAAALAEGAVKSDDATDTIDPTEVALNDDEELELQNLALGDSLNDCLEHLSNSQFKSLATAAAFTWCMGELAGEAVWTASVGKAPTPKKARKKATAK